MINWYSIFDTIETMMGNPLFLLVLHAFFVTVKGFVLATLIKRAIRIRSIHFVLIPLMVAICASMIDNSAWILRSARMLWFTSLDYRIYAFLIRIAWASVSIYYQSLAIFIVNLVNKKRRLPLYQKIFTTLSCLLSFSIIAVAILNFNCTSSDARPAYEWILFRSISLYCIFPLSITSIYLTIKQSWTTDIPILIRHQLESLLSFVVIPYLASDLLQAVPINLGVHYVTSSHTFTGLSNIFFLIGVYICSQKVMGLRFLNLSTHVEAPLNAEFMRGLKHVLEQLSHVTNTNELKHISQNFFKESFGIMHGKATLYIRKSASEAHKHIPAITSTPDHEHTMVETFFASAPEQVLAYTKETGVLIYDEIAFSNFYEETNDRSYILSFLDSLPADLFLPIYHKQEVLGYIVIERHARSGKLYSNVDRDEMLIFGNYLANIINLLHTKNVDALLQHTKNLQEEVFRKHQEIHQYKESIRSFMRNNKHDVIGVVFYKNRRFTFANQAAHELVMININTMEGHPLSKAFRSLANHVTNYKTSHTIDAKDINGNRIILNGMPHLEHNQVIIMVHYPEISDLLNRQVALLHDPSEWDYLLYLETTQSGKLVNQLIPGTGPTLLKFKVELLKLALGKKAILLDDIDDQDLMPVIELLHHISLREKLHIIDLQQPTTDFELAIKLFGIHHVFHKNQNDLPLLSMLDGIGTLCIKNIHFMDRDSQEYLAEFLSYGIYRTFKGPQKTAANVRVICSSDQDLHTLVQQNRFSAALLHELRRSSLSMPPLETLPEDELNDLAEGFSEQTIAAQSLRHLFALTDADKHRLTTSRSQSFSDLKNRVQQLIIQKSKKNQAVEATLYDPEHNFSDPELIEAARLGKHALKNQAMMTMLWKKLKNQNKIAHFLGVNRSSVNRRIKEYNLE